MPPPVYSLHESVAARQPGLKTPYYLVDEARLRPNLELIAQLRERTGARSVLALKGFATWSVFDFMRPYLDGTTSSSLYEARLGAEKFGGEVHAYSVAFSADEVRAVRSFATKIIFNSVSQLRRFRGEVAGVPIGLRLNPGISHSGYDLADPGRRYSRLGVIDPEEIAGAAGEISGVMFHWNCENADFAEFSRMLDEIGARFDGLLSQLEWVSLGGGIAFTKPEYPFDAFCEKLRAFARQFDVQVYLEPGDAVVAGAGFLVTSVLDVIRNEKDIAIVDAGTESHMLDVLIYGLTPRVQLPADGTHEYLIAGRSCLAGDVFGTYRFPRPLEVGSVIVFEDAAQYTMVKKNWFNGLAMPAIVIRRLDGRVDVVREFDYQDYVQSLS